MVKPEFKQTEVGEIPTDWNLYRLEQLTSEIGDGIHATPIYTSNGEYYFINGNNISDGNIIVSSETKKVSAEEYLKHKKNLSDGSVLLSINGTIGNLAFYRGEAVVLGKSAAYLNIKNEISSEYAYYALQSSQVKKHFDDGLTGTTIKNLSLGTIRNTPIPVPAEITEQNSIAEALSECDLLISSLAALIAKTRDIKTATMQQLLTGKKRLPGFSKNWSKYLLGEIGQFRKGRGIRKDEVLEHGLPCVRYGEIYTRHNDYIKNFYSFINPSAASEAHPLNYGDLLFAGSGETAEEIGKCVAFVGDEKAYAGGDIVICSTPGQNPLFLGYLMNERTIALQKARMGQGDAVVHIHAKNLAEIEIFLPDEDEQTAIAEVLIDMDQDIDALEEQIIKTSAIKQGMMQELLTGRTRLI